MKATELLQDYSHYKHADFSKRYLSYSAIKNYLFELEKSSTFKLKTIGYSVNKESIFSVSLGTGKTNILMWSQMHGNESTTTKAVLDFLHACEKERLPFLKELLQNCRLTIIPVLSPDGLRAYTRVNANNVDLNRDAVQVSQPESRVLQAVFNEVKPDFCFNLHDQRTIFSAGNQPKSASVSFLAPAYDEERNVNDTRKKAMQLISVMNEALQNIIPNEVGRYDDSFNLNCVGDFFQSKASTTILFEAGHVADDYNREETRKLIFIALLKGLEAIVEKSYLNYSVKQYEAIPENQKLFYDCIIRSVIVDGKRTDLAIQFEERLEGDCIKFIPKLEKVGELDNFFGHQEFKGNGKVVMINNSTENLELGIDIESINLGNEDIFTDLTFS